MLNWPGRRKYSVLVRHEPRNFVGVADRADLEAVCDLYLTLISMSTYTEVFRRVRKIAKSDF